MYLLARYPLCVPRSFKEPVQQMHPLQNTEHLLPSVFALFYWCINVGSFASMACTPLLLKYLGPSTAFSVPGIFMGLALLVFWAGRKMYILVQPAKSKQAGFLRVSTYCLGQSLNRRPGEVSVLRHPLILPNVFRSFHSDGEILRLSNELQNSKTIFEHLPRLIA